MLKMMEKFYIPAAFGLSIEVYIIMLILSIPAFFIWRRLLKKVIEFSRTRMIASWAAALVTSPLIYSGLALLWFFSINYYPKHDFDKEMWFSNKENRYEFSDYIIDSKMLIGKTKSEVRQILGDEGNLDESNFWGYYLGFKPGIGNIDPDVLDIVFKDGKVISVGQHKT